MEMKPYKIVVAYDGTAYSGWQEQSGHATVAGTLQSKFEKVFGHAIKVVGASRTDAGVHALGQVARFYTSLTLSPERICKSWNGALPEDIHIRSVELVSARLGNERIFHPQHNVAQKIYCYHVATQRLLPHWSRYCYFYPRPFDKKKLEQALHCYVGTHDFSAFCSKVALHSSTICRIDSITVTYMPHKKMYRITVCGNRFLYNMVRRIVGAALKIASSDTELPALITQALHTPSINFTTPTAPAHGLVLRKILYKS